MFIEDLLQYLNSYNIRLNSVDRPIIQSFAIQLSIGKKITEKQGNLIVKFLQKYKSQINVGLGYDVSTFLDNPQFKNSFRTINYQRSMSIVDHKTYKRAIKVEFPYNEEIIDHIRKECRNNAIFSKKSYYDNDEKCWFFSLNERLITYLIQLIKEFNFQLDDELAEYVTQISEIQKNIENYLPTLVKNHNNYEIINLPKNIQLLHLENLEQAIFTARKYGVTVWDNAIEKELIDSDLNETTIKFVKTQPDEVFNIDLTSFDIQSIGNIVKNLLPCLVIIPGGLEMKKLSLALDLFNSIKIENSKMSVLFRLNNSTDSEFNQFVKNNGLNSPLSEETKVVFLSQHIPKTILSPLKQFNSLLNFNYVNVHYKLAALIQTQENVINILEKPAQRRLNFANL
jgi:hypothetical protein